MAKVFEIEEDKNTQQGSTSFTDLMTPEQMKRGSYYQNIYLQRRGEVDGKYKTDWEYLQQLYECKRFRPIDKPDAPNNFVPLLTPTVEGQVASMMESDIDFRHVTNNPAHESYMRQFDAASEYYRTKTKFKPHFKDFARTYDLLGNGYVTISWEKNITKSKSAPSGIPRISVPPVLSILVDGRIKDAKDLQYADYIIHEIGFQTVAWARREYGDAIADALNTGYNRQEGLDPDISYDDTNTFTLLHVWTRSNPEQNLQLIEMDTNGLIFRESDSKKPYYENVDNEYPFAIARMIPQLGQFYGIGDGAILRPMQETVNNLTDEVEIAARFSSQTRLFVDKKSHMSLKSLTSDPSQPIPCDDPNGNILPVPGSGVNNVVFNMIEFLLREAQKATRFNETMTGNTQGASATATQINTQLTQGSVGIKDKKTDLAEVMGWADMYALKLCIEKWDKPFWASIGDGKSIWIDPVSMSKASGAVPTSAKRVKEALDLSFQTGEPANIPDFETVEGAEDAIEFSTKVIIGESVPKGRTDMYNIMLGLAQMQVMGKDGVPEPLISADRLRQGMEDILGMKLRTAEEEDMATSSSMNNGLMNKLNPIGNGDTVQVPTATPDNLQSTVPQMPSGDPRSVQI
jgi:hypothetical protein